MNKEYFLNRLRAMRPSALVDMTYDLVPESFASDDKIPIGCPTHGVFYKKAIMHIYSGGCAKCGVERAHAAAMLPNEEFIRRSKVRFGDKFDYSKTSYAGTETLVTITCPEHGDFLIKPPAHIKNDAGCPQCGVILRRDNHKLHFIKESKIVHNNKFDYSKVVFTTYNDKVEIICPKHGAYLVRATCHLHKKNDCPKCSFADDRLTTDSFIEKSKIVHGNSYDYSKSVYTVNSKPIIITCPEHGDFTQRAASHLAGNACMQCFINRNKLSFDEFVERSNIVHSFKFDYSKAAYSNLTNKIEIICPTHGSFWQTPGIHVNAKMGCRFCSESHGEREVERFLKKYNIGHIREHRIMPYRYRYDFFLPDFNIYIEYNGQQHYKPVPLFGGEEAFKKVQYNDKMKKMIVSENDGRLIIITYLHKTEEAVEKEMILSLKRIYNYWLIINGELKVFKKLNDVCRAYELSFRTLREELIPELGKVVKDLQVLF